MTSIQTDRTDGLSSSTAIKGPCKVATTANITLSGEQTIDGVSVVTGDRVLVKNQTSAADNGIYVVDTGPWRRAKDFSSNRDVRKGTAITVAGGSANIGFWQVTTADPISIGTTQIAFDAFGSFSGPASSVTDNIVTFAGTTGKVGKDSGVAVSSVATTASVSAAISALSSVYQAASSVLTALAGIGAAVAGDIIYATGAGAWGRLAKGTASQALLMNSGATAPQWSTLPFTKSFQSTQQTITSAGSLTLAHGLGKKPGLLMTSLVCLTAEAGYSVGDEVFVSQAAQSLVPDATNINVRFGSTAGTSYSVMHKTTGVTPTGLTNANWQFVVRAWA